MSALVEKMCHFGEMPWHGESEALTGTESANEVMVKAGLIDRDWETKNKTYN